MYPKSSGLRAGKRSVGKFELRVSLCVLVLAAFVIPAFSQSSGQIQGTLVDVQGGAIVNARVTALDEAKQVIARETTTGTGGVFQLQPLLPGGYAVKIEAKGFKTVNRTGLVLDPNQIMNLGDLTMEVGDTTERVDVTAEAPTVETSTAQRGFTLTSRQVTENSLNGRDFQSLMRTLPGVVSNDTSDFRLAFNNTDSMNINGMRGSNNNFYLDGSINTDVGANDGQYTQLSMDAVGEFREQTNVFNAEYGRNPGILLSAAMKTGSRQFHGTGYEFLRNNEFDARKPFDTTGTVAKLRFNQFGGNFSGPIYLGKISPRREPKVFFFFNYEGTRASRPNNTTPYVDTIPASELTGDFTKALRFNADGTPVAIKDTTKTVGAPGYDTGYNVGTVFQPGTIIRNSANAVIGGVPFPNNVVPQSQWSKNAPAFLKVINMLDRSKGAPTPGDPTLLRVPMQDTYIFSKNQKALRTDYNVSPKINFFFHWVDDAQQESQGLGIFSGNSYPVMPEYRKKPGASWAWNMINVISPTLTNEFIFTYNHLTQVVDIRNDVTADTYDRAKLGFTFQELYPNSNVRHRFPTFSCGTGCNISSFPPSWLSEGKTFAWTDNLTKVLRNHTFKTGVFLNRNNNGQQPAWTDTTNINFGPSSLNPNDSNNTLANLLLGNYTSSSQTNGVFYGSFRFFQSEAFVQDSWKASRHLTLEYGLRWAYLGPTNTYGKFLQNYFLPAQYDPSQAVTINTTVPPLGSIVPGSGNPYNGMVQEGFNGLPLGGVKHRHNNLGPRLGIAWDPFGDGKMSIRAGGGIFYERIRQNNLYFDGLGNPPLTYTPTVYAGQIDNLSPSLIAGGTRFPVSVVAIDQEGKIPTTYAWSLDAQRELARTFTLDVAYVHNQTAHLMYIRDINQLPVGTTVFTPILTNANNQSNAIRSYKGYTNVNFTDFGATSNYNALQVRATRRFAQRLTANVSFVWSKAMDEVDTDTSSIGYYLDRRREYAPAGFDRTRVFSADYVYLLPDFGTRLSSSTIVHKLLDGWQISGITRFWSGPPFSVTSNGNPGTLGGGVRAAYIGGDVYPSSKSRYTYFNPLVFARPADGTLGNVGRNTIRGPGINNWDMSMFKNTKFGEHITTQLRFEFFNVFNHTQWAGVNAGINVPNAATAVTTSTLGTSGQVSGTRDPRNIQLGFKLMF